MREKYKLDFDFYSREVKGLKEKSAISPAKLEKKETKLANAEAVLTAYSTELFHNIRALQQQRDAILLPQLGQVWCVLSGVLCGWGSGGHSVCCLSPRVVPSPPPLPLPPPGTHHHPLWGLRDFVFPPPPSFFPRRPIVPNS